MASEWIDTLSEENRRLFEETMLTQYNNWEDSDSMMKTYHRWEDDTRKYNGLPPRVI